MHELHLQGAVPPCIVHEASFSARHETISIHVTRMRRCHVQEREVALQTGSPSITDYLNG